MIGVMGAGAFGTALAISLTGNGPVTLWARDRTHIDEMRIAGENARRLPGTALPDTLRLSADIDELQHATIVLLAVPMQKLRTVLTEYAPNLAGKTLVACCKGVELETLQGPVQVITETVPDAVAAILTGPGFAHDIAKGLPTAMTLACADALAGGALQDRLSTANLRLYRTTDTIGSELGGALKNVMAIACGAAMGAGLGESARAALMTRGYAEMQRMAQAVGARAETLSGLSGFGDLTLTCTSEQSRNARFGLSIGRGEDFDASVTVEGAATAQAVQARARALQIDMPITDAVCGLTNGQLRVDQAMNNLLSRPLKEEKC
ncbi:NAD(P)-dependent glycerol-3-phosphate dehydrogenase [Pseudohalocynthiibacter aestuariivivens]|uniref:Glycerol-3-phosphate dehydrogenase [NAD(P)+] n=1 Tax=Roseovarius pelagicus TaxID=2980108 RepID=A0ABY6D9A0_9RHOB|nr:MULTISPECIES: NAD(P)H-dependent glycerol-3-phosphate dehydrogenase [Rhodobacterales]QIE45393.1 NAD(P)-dependent glycerol-3-phosphate dehydrogenase [Pseudohalocynthiibacter aestuariivivens]UXX82687.1 NAD(P)-dependent glycerol-3-phosphate dehydrogenase [Roseovarius pelagicus]